jgi:hypothetical protein
MTQIDITFVSDSASLRLGVQSADVSSSNEDHTRTMGHTESESPHLAAVGAHPIMVAFWYEYTDRRPPAR